MSGDAKLTRIGIAQRLQNEVGSQAHAQQFTDAFFDALAEMIAANDNIKIHNFGAFRCAVKKERAGRNPRTGAKAVISERRTVRFAAADAFKKRAAQRDQ